MFKKEKEIKNIWIIVVLIDLNDEVIYYYVKLRRKLDIFYIYGNKFLIYEIIFFFFWVVYIFFLKYYF